MGQVCSMDDFNGQGQSRTISPQDEIFIEGQLPRVNQNHSTFNDDDVICINIPGSSNNYQRQSIGQPYSVQPYNIRENVHIKVQAQGMQNPQNLTLLISVITKEIQLVDTKGSTRERNGIDLICLIDHSGSMMGEKIYLVQKTLSNMLEFLAPQDRLCLIMFDCRCYRMTRLMKCTPNNLPKFKIAIHALQARGGTDIGNGMKMALSVLKHRRYKNPVSAIFLLSDGEDGGAEERVRSDLIQYNIRDPFTIKTFGFGRDVCPKIMSEIAHLKEGQFYFLPNLNMIDICFMEALGGLISVIANNIQLTVKPTSSKITLKKAYGDKWQYDQWNHFYTLYQPHLLSGVHKDFVFDVQLNGTGPISINVILELDPIEQGQRILITETVEIQQFIENSEQNQEVIANLYRVKGAEAFNQALLLAQQGNYQQSQQVLAGMQQQIQVQHINDPQLNMVTADLQMAQQYCYPSQFEAEGRHHMTQLHIVHMYQKSRGVQINAYQNGQQVQLDCSYQNNIQRQYKQDVIVMQQGNQLPQQTQNPLIQPGYQSQTQQAQYQPNQAFPAPQLYSYSNGQNQQQQIQPQIQPQIQGAYDNLQAQNQNNYGIQNGQGNQAPYAY